VAWERYHRDINQVQASESNVDSIEAYDASVLFDGDGFSDDEQTQLKGLIQEVYLNGVALGFAAELNKLRGTTKSVAQVVASPAYDALFEATVQHVEQLARWLDETTAKQVVQSLQESIALGYDQSRAVEKLMDDIGDLTGIRAERIARTEAVRAYSLGRQTFAVRNGATQKTWQALPGADAGGGLTPCLDNDGVTVDILDAFPSSDEMPPAHPNCRCRVDYIYPDGSIVMDV
jgi:hypothetical protein